MAKTNVPDVFFSTRMPVATYKRMSSTSSIKSPPLSIPTQSSACFYPNFSQGSIPRDAGSWLSPPRFPSRSPDGCRSAGIYCDLTIAMRRCGSDVAVRYGGHPNKSVGDAFLLVWRHLPVDMGNAFLARDDATKELLPKVRCSGGKVPRARWAWAHRPVSSHVIIHRVSLWCVSCSPLFSSEVFIHRPHTHKPHCCYFFLIK